MIGLIRRWLATSSPIPDISAEMVMMAASGGLANLVRVQTGSG